MKLDKNTGTGDGKYALIELRKLRSLCKSATHLAHTECIAAIETLRRHGVFTSGMESKEQQFFVMKHHDLFTADGLYGYLHGIQQRIRTLRQLEMESTEAGDGVSPSLYKEEIVSLMEYAGDIHHEALIASCVGRVIPT